MPSSSFFSFFFFLQQCEGSRGFEAGCPHFQQTMQLHEQRMKLKLSMQSNMRQWCLRFTQNTIEAHVYPHKYYVHVCAYTHKRMHSMGYAHTHSHTHRLSHQSHCFSFSLSCPINKTTYNSLQHIIRIERRYYQLLYALTDTSPFKVRTKSLDRVQKPGLSLSGAKNPRRYTAIL